MPGAAGGGAAGTASGEVAGGLDDGFWRGAIEDAVFAFFDCGIYDNGFARVRCQECRAQYLVAFSCQRREFSPSRVAKRGALFGAFLAEEVLEDVGQGLWTFTMPKMLRGVFRHHRELLGGLCRAAWEVVRDLMATAVGDPEFRPGMVSVVQTLGDMLGWHPHVHAIASRGGWAADGSFTPVPFVNAKAAEHLFRHRFITLLRDEELLTEERIELLLSWRHSGFSLIRSRHEGWSERSVPLRQRREIRHACRGNPPIGSSRR